MGVSPEALTFLLASHAAGVDFDSTATIGRQVLFGLGAEAVERSFSRFGIKLAPGEARQLLEAEGGYAEPMLRRLGANDLVSLDASPFEGCSIVHDMNARISGDLERRFSAVFDGGSLEHIFDVSAALENCMRMVRVGGHLLIAAPTNNYLGHGFYQFSPEFYYRALGRDSGFAVERLLLRELGGRRWYEVGDPEAVGRRVVLVNQRPTSLFVCARRLSDVEPLKRMPQQSDYAAVWRADGARGSPPPPERGLLVRLGRHGRAVAHRYVPDAVRSALERQVARRRLWYDRTAFRPVALDHIAPSGMRSRAGDDAPEA